MNYKAKFDKEIKATMTKKYKYSSPLAVPRIVKIVVNTGVGRLKDEKEKELIQKFTSMIAGQKAHARPAKKSIASFKSREGMIIGYKATLRGKRMYDFLDRAINVAFPRTRDFRGLNNSGIDEAGNLTIGIKDHTVFPEATAVQPGFFPPAPCAPR